MKILHVLGGRGEVGGAEIVVSGIVGGGPGIEHEIIAPFATAEAACELSSRVLGHADLRTWGVTAPHQLIAARRRLARHVVQSGADVVHAHLFHAAALVASVGATVPTVLTHHHGSLMVDQQRHASRLVDRYVGRRFDRVVAVSQAVATFLHDAYGYPRSLVEVISNGWVGQPQEPRREPSADFLVVGRFRPEKGHSVLLHAFAAVREHAPDATLRLVGDGPQRPDLERLSRDLGLAGSVEFTGALSDVWPQYADARIALVPSLTEPQGIVVLEAMAAGRPVIASRVGGIPEMVKDGRTGRLVPPGDSDALARTMLELHRDSALRERLGSTARQAAEEWRMERTVERYHDLYRRLAA